MRPRRLPDGPGPELRWYDDRFKIDPNTWEASRRYRRFRKFQMPIDVVYEDICYARNSWYIHTLFHLR
mgnify:CR=1 FL=1